MNCENCKVRIGAEFIFAIKQNKCPACGENIMAGDKLSSFLSLQTLLKSNFQDLDVEKISSLIVANFELTQIFKDSDTQVAIVNNASTKEDENKKADAEFKKKQMEEARRIKQMRDDALNEAQAESWGMKFDEDGTTGEYNDEIEQADIFGETTTDEIRKMAHEEKMSASRDKMLNSGGMFRRT